MYPQFFRIALMTGFVCVLFTSTASASYELRFTEIEQRLAAIEERLAGSSKVETASYLNDESVIACDNEATECYGYCEECQCGSTYGAVELYWARLHLSEDVTGKLSESYNISPRFVLGYESAGGLGARVRYWNYSRATRLIGQDDDIRFELDVIDLEGTNHIQFHRTDLRLGGGLRLADVNTLDVDNDAAYNDMCGLTVAADLRTQFALLNNRVAAVYGGRISLLGGDWDGSTGHDFINRSRDNNIVVHELYSGLEYRQNFGGRNFFTRMVWEMQTWQNDSMERADSFGFVGPSLQLGSSY